MIANLEPDLQRYSLAALTYVELASPLAKIRDLLGGKPHKIRAVDHPNGAFLH